MSSLRIEGYWASQAQQQYPDPNTRVDDRWEDRDEFLRRLHYIEADLHAKFIKHEAASQEAWQEIHRKWEGRIKDKATRVEKEREQDAYFADITAARDQAPMVAYRGWSSCRMCGCLNGTREYQHGGWRWPEGYAHYIEQHNIVPTADFITFINNIWKTNNG